MKEERKKRRREGRERKKLRNEGKKKEKRLRCK